MTVKKLYVISLENEKWILHISNQVDINKIFIECELLYNFVKMNKPVNIHETIEIMNELEIDMYVKKYMSFYGIENVRGGSYSQEIIPDCFLKSLYFELGYSLKMVETDLDIIENIMNNCECISSFSNDDIDKIKSSIETKLNDYYITKSKYDSIKSYIINGIEIDINRNIIEDLKWLSDYSSSNNVISAYKMKEDIHNNYQRILIIMNAILKIFLHLNGKDISFEPTIYLEKPYICLDTYIYHLKNKNFVNDNDYEKMKELLSIYEYMFYFILNRKEELEFDLSIFSEKYIKELNYTLNYVNMIQEKHIKLT
jgi:hypothetical protein